MKLLYDKKEDKILTKASSCIAWIESYKYCYSPGMGRYQRAAPLE